MAYYVRRLPHWHPEHALLFVTWRLAGSLPPAFLPPRTPNLSGSAFVAVDRLLDRAQSGPVWLKNPRIARCVADSLRFADREMQLYTLRSFVVMPNHVHMLIQPRVALPQITQAVKGFTAREANRILGMTGVRFWQPESYDHWIRNESECQKTIRYIERNPVAAGLAPKVEDWPWSSAYTT